MMRYYYLTVILSIVCFYGLYAQQDVQYTQYMYNTSAVNPGYAGSRGVISVTGLHRSQWIGLSGAPQSQILAGHSPLGSSDKLGFGLSLIRDAIGVSRELSIDVDFSYTIFLSRDLNLAFGLKAGGQLLDVDFETLNRLYSTDPQFSINIDNKFQPNVGTGLYLYSADFYVGLSVPRILEVKHFDEFSLSSGVSSSSVAKERVTYYLMGGYAFDINRDVQFKPAFLTKAVVGAPLQVDLSANFWVYEKVTFGLGYRLGAAISGMLGLQISDSFMVGLAYDREYTALGKALFNDGSIEIVLRYELLRKYGRMMTPRFF